jgi:uncharacterized membrane protein
MAENSEIQTTNGTTKPPKENSLWNLIKVLWRRLTEPIFSIIFWCIFLTVVIIGGGLGFWIPYFSADRNKEGYALLLATSLATYFIAIVATGFADLTLTLFEKLFDAKNYSKDNKPSSAEVSLWAFVFLLSVIAIILGVVSLVKTDNDTVYYCSRFGTAIALFIWWIVNSDNKKLKESTFDTLQYNAGSTIDSNLSGQGVKDGTAHL